MNSGHRRPLGTTTRVRMDWSGDRFPEPELGDVTQEQDSERCYLVVGVEEHRDSPRVWRLVLERISVRDSLDRELAGARFWPHVRYRRGVPRPQ